MKTTLLVIVVQIALLFLVSSCEAGSAEPPTEVVEAAGARIDPPEDFRDLKNPFERDREAAEKGQIIFQQSCTSCHGEFGYGDGPVAGTLNPKPTNLAVLAENWSDGYLYWRIYDGGQIEPFRSMMPSWKGLLSEEQIWQIVTFIRSLNTD